MEDVLRDPIWQFLGATFAFLTIVVTIIMFLLQRSKKNLSYSVLTYSTIFSVNDQSIKENLDVRFKGEKIENLYFITLKILNSGNKPILTEDYESPVSFYFNERTRIFNVDILETEPKNMIVNVEQYNNGFGYKPQLLNPKDSITFKVLVDRDSKYIVPNGRIVGVKSIQEYSEEDFKIELYDFVIFLLLVVIFPAIAGFALKPTVGLNYAILISLSLSLIVISIFVIFILSYKPFKKLVGRVTSK